MPNPKGPLSNKVSFISIAETNKEVGEVNPEVKILPLAKTGCPLLLWEMLDNQVKAYVIIRSVRESGGPVTSNITIAVGRVIVRKYDSKLLIENGGPLSLTTNWATSLLYRMNFVKRKGCSTTKNGS